MSSLLEQTLNAISTPNVSIEEAARERLRQQARPAGSLGMLETLSARLAGISGTLDVQLRHKVIVTCAGDHGVVAEGVSRFPQEVTKLMVLNFVNDGASINVLARHAGARVCVADLGVNCDFSSDLPIFHKKVAHGTGNLAVEPAMTREQAIRSLEAGIEIVEELLKQGPLDILGTGDMGIANTTPSSAIIAAFSGLEASEVTGRGTGIDDSALQNKIRVINQALKRHQPNPDDALDVLAKVGGLEIGGLAGLVLGAAAHGIPVVCDGLISTAGALVACKLAPRAKAYLFASHRSVEVGHRFMHQQLNLEPILDFGMRLGEGTGAALAMEILDASTRVLADIKTFDEVAIADAQK